MHTYLLPLQKAFTKHADEEGAAWSKIYMKGQFDFFGMDAKTWRLLTKEHFKQHGLPPKKEWKKIVKELFAMPEREYQYFAVEMLGAAKKEWDKAIISLIEYCILTKSWWETVDHAATTLTGTYFKMFPEQIGIVTGSWNRSGNFWLQRSSIMFQKFYKKDTDLKLLSTYILHLADSKEFFVQKAIGWALREYSKTDPKWVTDFVNKNKLAPLSAREALKNLF